MFTNKMIGPVIKKKKVLFIAMILIVMVTSFLATGFSTSYFAFRKNTDKFFNEYIYPDITFVTENSYDKATASEAIKKVEGIEAFETRSTFYKALYRTDGYKTIKVTSTSKNNFTKFYVCEEASKSSKYLNVGLDYVFARNNGINVGYDFALYGGDGGSKAVHVEKLIATPETTHPMVQQQYDVDKFNFGFMFADEDELKDSTKGFPSDINYNEITIKLKKGYTQSTVADKLKGELSKENIIIKTTVLKDDSRVVNYIYKSILNNFQTVAIVVPLVFVIISLFLLALFQYQIAKSMTREMGILNALGVKKKSLFNLLFRFNLRVSVIGLVGGVAGGFGFANIIYNICKNTYGMPLGFANFNIGVTAVVVAIFIGIAIITSLLALFSIRKLSPKEAMINAMDKNKPLPRGIDNLTKRSVPMNLACNSMHKNRARFVVSLFAIIMSTAVTYGGISYSRNANVYVSEYGERLRYDAQIFNTSKDETNIDKLKTQLSPYSTASEYTYSNELKFTFNGKSCKTLVCGINPNTDLVYIPGNLKPTGNGIILEKNNADKVGVKVGENINVKVNDTITTSIRVDAISNMCTDNHAYMSIGAYKKLYTVSSKVLGFKSLLIKFDNSNKKNIYRVAAENEGLPLFTSEAIATYTKGCRLIIIVSYVCAGLSLVIALVTIKIMCTASLEDQKRKLSTLRVLGFSSKKTFKVFKDEVLTYLILGLIPGIPAGIGLNYLLAKLATTDTFEMTAVNRWWVFLVTLAFVILIVIINLLIGKRKIKKWDIAENTRSKE